MLVTLTDAGVCSNETAGTACHHGGHPQMKHGSSLWWPGDAEGGVGGWGAGAGRQEGRKPGWQHLNNSAPPLSLQICDAWASHFKCTPLVAFQSDEWPSNYFYYYVMLT